MGARRRHVAQRVIEAHDHAVDVALGYLEREAAKARRGKAGWETIDGDGFVGGGVSASHVAPWRPTAPHPCAGRERDAVRRWQVAVIAWPVPVPPRSSSGAPVPGRAASRPDVGAGVSWTPTVKGFAEIDGIALRCWPSSASDAPRSWPNSNARATTPSAVRDGPRNGPAQRRRTMSTTEPFVRDWTRRAAVHGLAR